MGSVLNLLSDSSSFNRDDPKDSCLAWLGGGRNISSTLFGFKAKNLDQIFRKVRIPRGFCVSASLVHEIFHRRVSKDQLDQLVRNFDSLRAMTNCKSVIVRSSSVYEDGDKNQFAGLFNSEMGIDDGGQLINAICDIYRSSNRQELNKYADKFRIDLQAPHMAVLVQEQIDVDFSGVAQDIDVGLYLEIWEGHLWEGISGVGSPISIKIKYDGSPPTIISTESISFADYDFSELTKFAMEMRDSIGQGIVFEFGIKSNKAYVFQVRNALYRDISIEETALQGVREYGLKAASMRYFKDNGLFPKPMFVFPPFAQIEQITDCILRSGLAELPTTVRYSKGVQIGLPRFFDKSGVKAIETIQRTRYPEWSLIIHEFIKVKSSFEIVITKDDIFLEHVPGIWESDSILHPDAIHIRGPKFKAWIWSERQRAKVDYLNGFELKEFPPANEGVVHSWINKLIPIADKLKSDFKEILPLNVHFIEDTDEEWHFLNLRRGFSISLFLPRPNEVYEVSDVDDLRSWDGQTPILLKVTTARGDESTLLSLAEELPKGVGKVYSEFGMLSHPAMVLREYGINVLPIYMSDHEYVASSKYKFIEGDIDVGDSAYRRIMAKLPVYSDDDLHVVFDREPICDQHLLVLSKPKICGFADSLNTTVLEPIFTSAEINKIFKGNDFILFEKGRGTFCTGEQTEIQAHAHLLPQSLFEDNFVEEFAKEFDATRYNKLQDAILTARSITGSYVLFGNVDIGFYVADILTPVQDEKRWLRNRLHYYKQEK